MALVGQDQNRRQRSDETMEEETLDFNIFLNQKFLQQTLQKEGIDLDELKVERE